jgi:hypothetical protein
MSYLYRPTPVVNLGNGAFASKNVRSGWPGATMAGIPRGAAPLGGPSATGAAARMRRVDTRQQPWLKTSGTMGSFIPNGLGDDSSFDFSGADAFGSDTTGFDFSGAGDISPLFDAPLPFSPGSFAAPDLGTGIPSDTGGLIGSPNLPVNIGIGQPPAPLAPPPVPKAGAGATGTGIPGTQPIATATQGLSLLQKIFGAPTTPAVTPYKALPGYGGVPVASGASWFSQSTLAPTIGSNGMVAGIAVGVIVLIAAIGGGGYAAGKSR